VLPGADATGFLQACLLEGDTAARAWSAWLRAATQGGTPVEQALVPYRSFLPLLAWSLRRSGAAPDPGLDRHLRFAVFTEELRIAKYREVCAAVFDTLRERALDFVVLKGAALADPVYPSPVLRHSDDIDLWLRADALDAAEDALRRRGWEACAEPTLPSSLHRPALADRSAVPVELHGAFLTPAFTPDYARAWGETVDRTIAGRRVRALSSADTLHHVCVHGLCGLPTLRWVADAVFLLRGDPAFSWQDLLARVAEAGTALPMCLALTFLARNLGVRVPDEVLDRVTAEALAAPRRQRLAVEPWPRVPTWPPPAGWRGRWQWTRGVVRAVFPPSGQMALAFGLRSWQVPFAYAHRLSAYVRAPGARRRRPGWPASRREQSSD
jgi:hypothetical protein